VNLAARRDDVCGKMHREFRVIALSFLHGKLTPSFFFRRIDIAREPQGAGFFSLLFPV
jgi:hypothetical protein